ncbi:protein trichome birefringence-like isoform X2 [Prosopis cineraria]|uniref:protein trichome birefringence-like isoform X2 n=1 Tax=Prosopis cineraria TaxID=364024 RepID=UPI00240F0CB1|nr:protein trichome birefringence-like isoform X2 [Prosopis cineraria]
MADATKYLPVGGGNLISDLMSFLAYFKTRRSVPFAYGFTLAFVAFTFFLAFSPSPNASSPPFTNILTSSSTPAPYKSQFNSLFSYFLPNISSPDQPQRFPLYINTTSRSINVTSSSPVSTSKPSSSKNHSPFISSQNKFPATNQTALPSSNSTKTSSNRTSVLPVKLPLIVNKEPSGAVNHTRSPVRSDESKAAKGNQTTNVAASPKVLVSPPLQSVPVSPKKNLSSVEGVKGVASNNYTASLAKKQSNSTIPGQKNELIESLMKCDLFDGEWIKDDSYPLYKPGSCSLIDEQFDCIQNGRPDKDYLKYKWKPKGCSLPRLDGHRLLNMLRGKRLVFVGDSLNRNMWESLICILRHSVENKSRVYEANGRVQFRGEASYSFVFEDYNFTVELFVSPFLVQEWETANKNGSKKQTLRLDLVGKSSDEYKDADIMIFNTGHWWTHEKTSRGKDYYQEGSHVYEELNVLEAFRRAITTWSRWVDANVNPSKSMVLFRGYSASHFRCVLL